MPTFKNAKDLEKHIKKAMDALQAEVLITTQARLGSKAVSPVQTGRFRSSWFAAEGSASSQVAPEGANSPNTDARSLKVDSKKDYHLTNNLPYAQRLCLESYAVSKPGDWFTSFVSTESPKIAAEAARQIKSEFDL
jgi:hypothetical protein